MAFPWSNATKRCRRNSLIRVYTVCPGLSVRKLRIITVARILKLWIEQVYMHIILLFEQRKTKVLIRLHACAGWSAPLLFAYVIWQVFARPGLCMPVIYRVCQFEKLSIFSSPESKSTPFKHLRNHWAVWSQISYGVSLGWGERLRKVWGQSDENSGFHGNQKLPLTYNGENVVRSITTSFLTGASSNLEVTTTSIKSRTSSILGQIGLFTFGLLALERRKFFP